MATKLVIVESPTKAKTLERYLGAGYKVKASYGHVRDLPKSKMAVDTEGTFDPEYEVPEAKKKVVAELKKAHKAADELWLATDFDREGEAIAWHVAEILGVDPAQANRVTFTEITKSAVQEAFEHPRTIDLQLVEAQQARRILDRLVGYSISPLLWKKVRPGLSAGRVQSPALRLIVEREREIKAFEPKEYWSVDARLAPDGDESAFLAGLRQIGEDKLEQNPGKTEKKDGSPRELGLLIENEATAQEHAANLERAAYAITEVKKSERKQNPRPPFTTSTLQQEAARKLGFTSRRTMRVAQQLYEGIDLPGEGQVGLITYHRTDSVTIAEQALAEIAEVVKKEYGADYTLKEPRRYKKKQRGAQEAHEAIRPTGAARIPSKIEASLDKDQAKLYRLIWQRAVASQMAQAIFDQVRVDIEATADDAPVYGLRATGQTMKFDGFRRVYFEGRDDGPDEDAENRLPELTAEQALRLLEVLPEQHFTQPPPRYSEASLIKELEALGIGRPSTYASIVSTLQDREYVRLEDRRFYPEDVGDVTTDVLVDRFGDHFLDYEFTARLEDELDDIAEGKMRWSQMLDEFHSPFERLVEKAEEEVERHEEKLDETCPRCPEEGREPGELVIKLGRRGKFVGCKNYPDCTYTRDVDGQERPEPELLEEKCPESGHPLMKRWGRYGPFIGCSGYPDCKYIKREEKKTGVTCPKCKAEGRDPVGDLIEKRARRRGRSIFYGCNKYPECDFTVGTRPLKTPCPECGTMLAVQKDGSAKCQEGHVIEDLPELAETKGDGEGSAETAGETEGGSAEAG